jgi:hypothetical protein
MAKKTAKKDIRVKKTSGEQLNDKQLDKVAGGVYTPVMKEQLSGPYDDRVGDKYTCSGDPAK